MQTKLIYTVLMAMIMSSCQAGISPVKNSDPHEVVNPVAVMPNQGFQIQGLSSPLHLEQVQNLLADDQGHRLMAANNQYSSDKQITWPEQGIRANATVCSTLVTLALKHAYEPLGLSSTVFKGLSGGSSSPTPPQYYQAFGNQNQVVNNSNQTTWKFQQQSLATLQAGDLMAIDYIDAENGCSLDSNPVLTSSASSASGHMTIVESVSEPVLTTLPGTAQSAYRYEITVLDSSSSYHGKQDTRYLHPQSQAPFVADQGLGRGSMRFYADVQTGQVLAYKWSQDSNNSCRPDQRRVKFARLIQF